MVQAQVTGGFDLAVPNEARRAHAHAGYILQSKAGLRSQARAKARHILAKRLGATGRIGFYAAARYDAVTLVYQARGYIGAA